MILKSENMPAAPWKGKYYHLLEKNACSEIMMNTHTHTHTHNLFSNIFRVCVCAQPRHLVKKIMQWWISIILLLSDIFNCFSPPLTPTEHMFKYPRTQIYILQVCLVGMCWCVLCVCEWMCVCASASLSRSPAAWVCRVLIKLPLHVERPFFSVIVQREQQPGSDLSKCQQHPPSIYPPFLINLQPKYYDLCSLWATC